VLKEAEGIDLVRPMLAVHTKLMPIIHGPSSPTKGRPTTTTSIGILAAKKTLVGSINNQLVPLSLLLRCRRIDPMTFTDTLAF
jgi:hypothetical protein